MTGANNFRYILKNLWVESMEKIYIIIIIIIIQCIYYIPLDKNGQK
jgi:hypothetical protein